MTPRQIAKNDRFRLKTADGSPPVLLRCIGREDIEDLRLWKNANRRWFFHKDQITAPAQKAWFEGYLRRDDDFLFVAEIAGRRAGFIGFRLIEGVADIYAVIARPRSGGRAILDRALRLMVSYIESERTARIACKLLYGDPALNCFLEQGFRIASKEKGHDALELDAARFQPLRYEKAPKSSPSASRT